MQGKQMVPRAQTFAWRLLHRALPIGKRASKFSKHIVGECVRCATLEDEMHMFFLCHFSKAAWFSSPWFIRTEVIAANHYSTPQIIQALLTSAHPYIKVTSLYTFCGLFGRQEMMLYLVENFANHHRCSL
ncbi:hypothetical protein VPH35_122919 [Triticum aestivum]